MNIPEYYEDVSLRLTEVLDASGLKDDLRWRRINTWLQIEEMENMLVRILGCTGGKVCYFGSQAEATTTDELLSDIDKVIMLTNTAVLQDLQFWVANPDTEETFLMVADKGTPPGYVKLQLVQRDAPIIVNNFQDDTISLDSKRRSVLCNNAPDMEIPFAQEHHGPAGTLYSKGITVDNVAAQHTRCWPDQASQWLYSRSRNRNWPTRRMIDVMQQTATLLVPVGHKLSPEQHLEWRLSFSFAEKLLKWQFNSTQYKCYVMLKFIKNTFINAADREHVLTSYHCKTCMFYLIEKTPASLWYPNNLLLCIDLCLRQLLSWVECKNCPNYFIPDENMFLGRNVGLVQGNIGGILHDLLRQKGRYITKIPFEHIGENVVRVCQSLPIELEYANERTLKTTITTLSTVIGFLAISVLNPNMFKLNLFKSSHGQMQEAFNIARSLFCSSLGIHLASQSLEQDMPDQEKLIMAYELLLWGSSSDAASGNLKLAAFYLVQGNLDTMEDVLNHVDAKLTYTFLDLGEMGADLSVLSKVLREDPLVTKLVKHFFALPVLYGPSDIYSTPKVLIFEIFRSTGSEPGLTMNLSHWIHIAEVKARLYFYFLQYQCFHLQGRVAQKLVAMNNIIWISKRERQVFEKGICLIANVAFRRYIPLATSYYMMQATTTLNLLAYCLKQGGRLMDAFKVLCKSMLIMNQHNAAKWQIATFINSTVIGRNVRQGQGK